MSRTPATAPHWPECASINAAAADDASINVPITKTFTQRTILLLKLTALAALLSDDGVQLKRCRPIHIK